MYTTSISHLVPFQVAYGSCYIFDFLRFIPWKISINAMKKNKVLTELRGWFPKKSLIIRYDWITKIINAYRKYILDLSLNFRPSSLIIIVNAMA